jgi:hypothetical protein
MRAARARFCSTETGPVLPFQNRVILEGAPQLTAEAA